jgi:hypothetical protein
MSETSTTDDGTARLERRLAATAVLVALVTLQVTALVALGPMPVGGLQTNSTATPTPTAAPTTPTPALDDVAPYFATEQPTVDNESFYEGRENASLDTVLNFLSRAGPIVIGSGPAQGGVGDAGIIVTGLLVGGILLGSVLGSGVGPVGGLVLAVTGIGGLATAAVLPAWFWPLLLFGLGITLSIVVVRSIR